MNVIFDLNQLTKNELIEYIQTGKVDVLRGQCMEQVNKYHTAVTGSKEASDKLWEQDISIKRNKKVDVPTEQWQKNIERRLSELEFIIKPEEDGIPRYGRKINTRFGEVTIPGDEIIKRNS